MKNIILISILLINTSLISGQQVDIEGDTKIVGKINIINAIADSSVFIGANAGMNDDGKNNNIFVGNNAGKSNTSGEENSFFGQDAGYSNTNGFYNSFFGRGAGQSNNTGNNNSFFGIVSGSSNTIGEYNSFFGGDAGQSNTEGSNNSFFGNLAGSGNTRGYENSFFGLAAGQSNTTGYENSFFGRGAGSFNNNTRSTLLGHNARTTDSLYQAIAIGAGARVGCHNCAVIGGTGGNAVKVGISVEKPVTKLHIVGGDDAELTKNHGYIINGDTANINLVIDNNEIMARNNGIASPLYLNSRSGNVAIGEAIPPMAKLDVAGTVRIRVVPSGTGDFVRINANGDLFRSTTSSLKSQIQEAYLTESLFEIEQNKKEIESLKLLHEKQMKGQNDRIKELESMIAELKEICNQLLIATKEK
jgi:hypothetical protein